MIGHLLPGALSIFNRDVFPQTLPCEKRTLFVFLYHGFDTGGFRLIYQLRGEPLSLSRGVNSDFVSRPRFWSPLSAEVRDQTWISSGLKSAHPASSVGSKNYDRTWLASAGSCRKTYYPISKVISIDPALERARTAAVNAAFAVMMCYC